ncbi:hypothetical protein [Paenibacillus alkalitolerans]|uniref:hypothetical protein n=1 Tax=Paenibacillus alkalitolerans TaxID=2799335 RepID=UPI0018F46046|nr:hypothetical protein [Paenibacillus alkalitolerans]
MRDTSEIKIDHGLVESVVTDTPARSFRVRWNIPLFDQAKQYSLIQSFASDALLAGRWAAGIPTDNDRTVAQAKEGDWSSVCTCGKPQPCRHAVTVLFRFRDMAKNNPWLWLEVRGVSREQTFNQIHANRLELEKYGAHKGTEETDDQDVEAARESPILMHAEDPPFWNRDISFADWLRIIYNHTKKGDTSR